MPDVRCRHRRYECDGGIMYRHSWLQIEPSYKPRRPAYIFTCLHSLGFPYSVFLTCLTFLASPVRRLLLETRLISSATYAGAWTHNDTMMNQAGIFSSERKLQVRLCILRTSLDVARAWMISRPRLAAVMRRAASFWPEKPTEEDGCCCSRQYAGRRVNQRARTACD